MEDNSYLAIKERAAGRLLEIPGVHAVGVGAKQVQGAPTGDLAIAVFVEHKRPLSEIPPDERVPEEIEGVKTDVIEMPVPTTLAAEPGQLFGANRVDDHGYRPVQGGTSCGRPGGGHGTFGCIFTVVPYDAGTILAATCHHVIYANCSDTPNHEEVGQPDGETSSTECCSHIVGNVFGAHCDEQVDIAFVKLKSGMEWLAHVEGVGAVAGTYPVGEADVDPNKNPAKVYPVKKRGRTTALTGGNITHIGTSGSVNNHNGTLHRKYSNGMLIVPNADPASPATPTDFALPGDSGSAVQNEEGKVVGILFAVTAATATASGTTFAFPVEDLIEKFTKGLPQNELIPIKVSEGEDLEQPHIVPIVGASQPALPPVTLDEAARLEEEIRTTPRGAWYSDLYHRHREEIAALVNSNRRVTVAWHRSGGPELVQWLVRTFTRPDARMPNAIQGRPIRACLDDFAAIMTRYASAALAADVRKALPTLPDVSGLSDREIIERLKEGSVAAPGAA
jgi:hypothetical protein